MAGQAGKRRNPGGFRRATGLFVLGCLPVWIAFSALASLMQWPLHVGGVLNRMMGGDGMLFGGLALTAWGLYWLLLYFTA